jgi:translation initiation factor IF-2
MSGLDESEVETLREKLGEPSRGRRQMVESRVEGSGGATVLRRRKRAKADSVPEPVVEVDSAAEVEESEPSVEEADDPSEAGEALDEPTSDDSDELGSESEEQAPGESVEPKAPATESDARRASPTADARSESPAQPAQDDRKGRQRKRVREIVNLQEQERFARQISSRGPTQRRPGDGPARPMVSPRRKRRDKLAARPAPVAVSEQPKAIKVAGDISVGELAKLIGAKAPVVQGKLMALGIMVSINQKVDVETCRKLAEEYGIEV